MSRELKGAPWLFPGVTNVSDCETAREVIEKAKLDFSVAKCEVVARTPLLGTDLDIDKEMKNPTKDRFIYGGSRFSKVENAFATYRTDTCEPLGLVKSKYEIVQNRDAFTFFNDAIGVNKALWDTAGCFDNGQQIFVSAKLPKTTVVNGKDNIENYLVFRNSHDGSTSVNILFTSIRIICQNCLPGAIKDGKNNNSFISLRHTNSVHGKIDEALEILGFAVKQAERMEVEFNRLALKKMNDNQVMDYIASIHLSAEEYSRLKLEPNGLNMLFARDNTTIKNADISTRKVNMITDTYNYYFNGEGQFEYRGTAWGAFNAITGYYSNIANLSGQKRMETMLYGNAGNVMSKALISVA